MSSSSLRIISTNQGRALMRNFFKISSVQPKVMTQQMTSSYHTKTLDLKIKFNPQVKRYMSLDDDQTEWKGDYLTLESINKRVMENVLSYDKIDSSKCTMESHFIKDLGLDSLDHVEVMMAIENEFGFFIPDVDAETLVTPKHIVEYLCKKHHIATS